MTTIVECDNCDKKLDGADICTLIYTNYNVLSHASFCSWSCLIQYATAILDDLLEPDYRRYGNE